MTYGVRPDGMDDAEWTLECQARMVVREMRAERDRTKREAIFNRWQKLPGVTRERVQRIWKDRSEQ